MTLKPRADTDTPQRCATPRSMFLCVRCVASMTLSLQRAHGWSVSVRQNAKHAVSIQFLECTATAKKERRKRERERVCVCVCVYERETKKGEAEREGGGVEGEVGSKQVET